MMVGRKCAVPPETAVEAIILFKDRVITSKDGEPRKYSYIQYFENNLIIYT